MKSTEQKIKGIWIIEPIILIDDRGYSMASYKQSSFEENIGKVNFAQDNAYAPHSDVSILWNDPTLAIHWGMNQRELNLSDKDKKKENNWLMPFFSNRKFF